MDYQLSSHLLEDAVNEISRLPGIGKRTAMRLALHLLKQDKVHVNNLANSLIKLREEIQYCERCHNISDSAVCVICANVTRDNSLLCVVEDIRDVIAIENTGQFKGLYHVLGGLINPMEGVSHADLNIASLLERCEKENIQEIVFALSSIVEGDVTSFFIYNKLKDRVKKFSHIARGIAEGDALEFADEFTLGRSIVYRMPYEGK